MAANLEQLDGAECAREGDTGRFCAEAGEPEPNRERDQSERIMVRAIGGINPEIIDLLKNGISRIFEKQVTVAKGLPEPDYAFNILILLHTVPSTTHTGLHTESPW